MTDYLTVEDLVLIAQAAVGHAEVSDWGLLASAVARPQASAFGQDVYPALPAKAAALLGSLVMNHGLVDGNKRLAWAATVVFCRLNDAILTPSSLEAGFELIMEVVAHSVNVDRIATVLADWMAPGATDHGGIHL